MGDRIRETAKPRRRRLARAELWLLTAVQVESWAKQLEGTEAGTLPPEQWRSDDPMIVLCRRYGLGYTDLAQEARKVADRLEATAERSGYAEVWTDEEG